MLVDSMMKKRSPFFNPEKTFELPVYAEQLPIAFANFGCSKPKYHKDTYALNILQFIDGSASNNRETSESSTNSDSVTKSRAT